MQFLQVIGDKITKKKKIAYFVFNQSKWKSYWMFQFKIIHQPMMTWKWLCFCCLDKLLCQPLIHEVMIVSFWLYEHGHHTAQINEKASED